MSTRWYPIYQRGNPQLRVFLPNFWMKLIKSEEPLPPNMVLFQTSIQMTQHDVKNYLEKIYKVPVVEVKTTIKMGTIRRAIGATRLVKDDDYKEALVTLPQDYNFEFPKLIYNTELKEMERYKKLKENFKSNQKNSHANLGIPPWFSSF